MRGRLAIVLATALLAVLAVWLGRAPDALAPLARVSPGALASLLAVSAVALVVQGMQFGALARLFDVRLARAEWLGLTCVNNLLTYALPVRGGTLVRAAYLHRVHGLALHAYAALTVSSHVMITGVVSVAGMALALGLAARGAALPSWLLIGFGAGPVAVVAGAWLLAALAGRIGRASARLGDHARAFREGLGAWRRRPDRALAFVAITIVVFALHGARMLVALRAVGLEPAWPVALLVHAGAAASAVIAVTPANLGTREAVVGVIAGALGLDARAAVLAALLERSVAALEAAAGSGVLARALRRRLRSPAG